MLPRELIEEWLGGRRTASLHIFIPLAHTRHGFFVVLTIRLQIVGQDIVEGVRRTLPASTGEFLQLREPFRFYRQRVHVC